MCAFRAGLRRVSICVFALNLLVLAACHEDGKLPSLVNAMLTFPPPVSSTDADSIVVRGTTSGIWVTSVRVNGIEAVSGDGYETWSVELALQPGENVLNVVTTEGKWNLEHAAAGAVITREDVAEVGSGPAFDTPASITPDFARNRLLVADIGRAALLEASLLTGDRRVISGGDAGSGVDFLSPIAVVLDEANNQALVLDDALFALLAVDLTTGERSVISDPVTGDGPVFDLAQSMTLDAANNRVLISDFGLAALLAVDLATGDRSVISDPVTGDGPGFSIVTSIVHDPANNRVLAGDFQGLLAVDLASGDRSVVSDDFTGTGTGQPLNIPASIALDSANDRALVAGFDFVESTLLAVNLANGNRSVIADNYSAGTGPCLCFLISIALDPANNLVLASDMGHSAMFAIDPVNGQRVIWSQ